MEELIAWAAYSELEHEDYKKQQEQAQKNRAFKGIKR
tara:strand:- start:611 stop:721 length:111 start_codon:yes stop_codon:yes gene_type:complete